MNFFRASVITFLLIGNLFMTAPVIALTVEPPVASPDAPKRFSFADVRRRAETLAASPFAAPDEDLPAGLKDLNFEQYWDIRYLPEKSLWRDQGLPFEVQFFPRGFIFAKQVAINIVEAGEVKPVTYSNELFDFGRNKAPENPPAELGFAGFRLLYPLNKDNTLDEFAVFLGASYFRAIGQNQVQGLSARGLAINTGLTSPLEEFPVFREFWIVKPDKDATELTVYALLDSASVTGAYRFVIRPGRATTMEVKTNLFMRKAVDKLGIAPLTSMYLSGENMEVRLDDFRPEVHDSDGLLLNTGTGEWIWRPLSNPAKLNISSFQDTNPHGFGLQQRDRNFDHYQDLPANYEKRPSAWVEPMGEWGKGVVQLVEIPSDSQKYDNMVTFWVPDKPTDAGQQLEYEYRLFFEPEDPARPPAGKTLSTRIGAGGTIDHVEPSVRRFVLDFGGKTLETLTPEAPVEAVVNTSSGKIRSIAVQQNGITNGQRVIFELIPDNRNSAELRTFLKSQDNVLSETWSYHWEPR